MNTNEAKFVEMANTLFQRGLTEVDYDDISESARQNGVLQSSFKRFFKENYKSVSTGVYVNTPVGDDAPEEDTGSVHSHELNALEALIMEEPKGMYVPTVSPLYVPFGCYDTARKIATAGMFMPLYISGESGNGKTFGVEQACAATGREYFQVNITKETTEEDLIGTFHLKEGNTVFEAGPVLKAFVRGAVLMLDEIDLGTSRIMCLQTILQNKPYYIKKTNDIMRAGKGFTVIATGNTRGRGDENGDFVGTEIMNKAFLDRFPLFFHQKYPDKTTEIRILRKAAPTADVQFVKDVVEFIHQTREAFENGGADIQLTTRRGVDMARASELFRGKHNEVMRLCTGQYEDDDIEALLLLWSGISTGKTYA